MRTLVHRGATIVLRAPGAAGEDIELGPGDDFRVLGPLCGVVRLTTARPDDDRDEEPADR